MTPGKRLHVRQLDALGSHRLGPGAADEPWHSAWPDRDGRCGFTLLLKLPDAEQPVRLQVWQ